jgi:hypothetical protein
VSALALGARPSRPLSGGRLYGWAGGTPALPGGSQAGFVCENAKSIKFTVAPEEGSGPASPPGEETKWASLCAAFASWRLCGKIRTRIHACARLPSPIPATPFPQQNAT